MDEQILNRMELLERNVLQLSKRLDEVSTAVDRRMRAVEAELADQRDRAAELPAVLPGQQPGNPPPLRVPTNSPLCRVCGGEANAHAQHGGGPLGAGSRIGVPGTPGPGCAGYAPAMRDQA